MDSVQRLPYKLVELLRVHVYRLPSAQQSGSGNLRPPGRQGLRIQRDQLLRVPPEGNRWWMRKLSPGFLLFVCLAGIEGQAPGVRTTYVVKQVASGAVYLDGGSNDGLKEGMRLKVWRLAPGDPQSKRQAIGDLTVTAVASLSAVCELQKTGAHVESGDTAELSYEDQQTMEAL